MSNEHKEKWFEATQEEMKFWHENYTYKPVKLSK